MKILLINGSPKGSRSNSLRLAGAFVDGVTEACRKKGESTELTELHLSTMQIGACKGCFACWNSTPGICCMKDDMQQVLEKQLWADLIVWSFPLYYFNVPGLLKNMIDRQLPMNLPFMTEAEDGLGSGSHPSRYDMSGKRHVLVSTCGFYSAEGNYDSVRQMFDHFLGRGNYSTVFCGQGELFRVKELKARTDQYLEIVKQAGREFVSGEISDKTTQELKQLLYPKDVFEKMADASWGVSKETGEKEPDDLVFTRQMALLYKKQAYDGKDRILEMCYTDLGHAYQILLGKDGASVYTDGSLRTTTRIETPFDTWAAIARGEISGPEALAKQMYTVSGDFSLMIHWDTYFGNAEGKTDSDDVQKSGSSGIKPPSMLSMLLPWIAFWIAVSINPASGSLITLGVIAAVPFMMQLRRLIFWDRLSMVLAAGLAIVTNILGDGTYTVILSYLLFGLMWLGSCAARAPLCAAYVKYDYGGESALDNPIFVRTNQILAMGWGVLYVLTALWTFMLRNSSLGSGIVIVNNLAPAAMGIFTVWFQNWYPAWVARGGRKNK